jgi:hypothetical protein
MRFYVLVTLFSSKFVSHRCSVERAVFSMWECDKYVMYCLDHKNSAAHVIHNEFRVLFFVLFVFWSFAILQFTHYSSPTNLSIFHSPYYSSPPTSNSLEYITILSHHTTRYTLVLVYASNETVAFLIRVSLRAGLFS